MASLQLSGLASGFDWKSVVDQLIELERVPQTRARSTQNINLGKLSGFSTLRTRVTALQDAAKALSSDALFGRRSVTQTDANVKWTASAAASATTGEYTFNVTQLATRSVRTGATGRASSLHGSNNVSEVLLDDLRLAVPIKAGVFTINGAQITVENTDTLGDVFEKISQATGDDVTAAYNSATDRVTLTSASEATITLGSGADTSNFLFALRLYNNNSDTVTSASALGTLNLKDAVTQAGLQTAISAVDGSGAGSFTINGTTINYNVNDDSLQSIITRVNGSAAGVTMAYDPANDRFTLTNQNTGDLGLTVAESAGGLLGALGLTTGGSVARGDNAQFSVNGGGTITSASNAFDESTHGIKGLTLTATSEDSQTVRITSDTAAIKTGIQNFIAKFNDVQKFVDDQTKVTVGTDGRVSTALFANNREVTEVARQLRAMVFGAVSGATGTIRRLEAIGIDFEGSSSELAVRDPAALDNALAGNLSEVAALFTTPNTGLTAKLQSYVTTLTRNNGIIDVQETTLERQNTSLDNQIAEIERRLTAERSRLEAGFIRMEEAQSLMTSQLATLQRTLGFES